jgi:hypothetical protein
VQLHFPFEFVHLVTSKRPGMFYKVAVDNDVFERYHCSADPSAAFSWRDDNDNDNKDDSFNNDDENDDDLDYQLGSPEKTPHYSPNTQHRHGGDGGGDGGAPIGQPLPPNYFLLTVPETIYRSVLDEICAAHRMPCGIFFCGHHEDVSRPSICIAVLLLTLLLAVMAYVAFVFT